MLVHEGAVCAPHTTRTTRNGCLLVAGVNTYSPAANATYRMPCMALDRPQLAITQTSRQCAC